MDDDKTLELLQAISSRLSTRAELRHCEYQLELKYGDNHELLYNLMVGWPIWVYPDRHHRKVENRMPVMELILQTQFKEDVTRTESGQYFTDVFVPGNYLYKLSVTKKQRKWFKEL